MENIIGIGELMTEGRAIPDHQPWPRAVIAPEAWRLATEHLRAERWALLGLWGDHGGIHMALCDESVGEIGVVSLECPDGRFPSVAQAHPPALHLEATVRDLFGLQPSESPDPRPWLDHGRWGVRYPLGPTDGLVETLPYIFLPAEGESLHEIAV